MSTDDEYYARCYDCERELSAREAVTREVLVTHDDGLGYDEVRVPLCPRCDLDRHGIECETCGELHRDVEAAAQCCSGPAYGDAPDCRECGRRMAITAKGYGPQTGPSVTVAECECCPVMWGAFTGWDYTDDDPCKHIDTDPREETA